MSRQGGADLGSISLAGESDAFSLDTAILQGLYDPLRHFLGADLGPPAGGRFRPARLFSFSQRPLEIAFQRGRERLIDRRLCCITSSIACA
jgi:hypothetical protein